MNLTKYGRIIGRESNVVRVDFGRESDPWHQSFRVRTDCVRRKSKSANDRWGLADRQVIPVLPRPFRADTPSRTVKVSVT
jgi:hypothetical protein